MTAGQVWGRAVELVAVVGYPGSDEPWSSRLKAWSDQWVAAGHELDAFAAGDVALLHAALSEHVGAEPPDPAASLVALARNFAAQRAVEAGAMPVAGSVQERVRLFLESLDRGRS